MPIYKKEFYFIRHGQTDYNAADVQADHPPHLKLNEMGKKQAQSIAPIITSLPLQTICVSPYQRAKETHHIISSNLKVTHYEINNLGECSYQVWDEMNKLTDRSLLSDETCLFLEQVREGINQALSFPGPVLVISHGGVYYAMCYLMQITQERILDNCIPVHLRYQNAKWVAKRLISSP